MGSVGRAWLTVLARMLRTWLLRAVFVFGWFQEAREGATGFTGCLGTGLEECWVSLLCLDLGLCCDPAPVCCSIGNCVVYITGVLSIVHAYSRRMCKAADLAVSPNPRSASAMRYPPRPPGLGGPGRS